MNDSKKEVIGSMEALTIRIFLRSDGDYDYQVWPCDLDEAQSLENEGDDTGADNGGVCTGNMGEAVEMASDAAMAVVRAHFSDNCFNPDVCPSSLDENGEPITDGETDHVRETPTSECNECGAGTIGGVHTA
jgi:hypothetical protein